MTNKLLVTVVVVVKSDRRIYRLLDSLLNQTIPLHAFEIIVVENGSTVLADVRNKGLGKVRYLHLSVANMAEARNAGLNMASGRYMLLTDADAVPQPDWIENMINCLSDGHYAAVGGGIQKFEPKSWTQRYGNTIVNGQTKLNYLPALSLPYIVGANAGFVTEIARNVGGFDARFKSGNDVDICYRLGLNGYKVGLAPNAVVLHEDRSGMLEHFRRFKHYAIYQVLLFATYRHISGRKFIINKYPIKLVAQAIVDMPLALIGIMCGDFGPGSKVLLHLIEAAGVWCGDIQGSIKYRQLYL